MRAVLFVIILAAVALSGAINAALGEEWLCETTILEGKPPAKTKWVINGDQMRAFGAKDAFRVLRNDDRFAPWPFSRSEIRSSRSTLSSTK